MLAAEDGIGRVWKVAVDINSGEDHAVDLFLDGERQCSFSIREARDLADALDKSAGRWQAEEHRGLVDAGERE